MRQTSFRAWIAGAYWAGCFVLTHLPAPERVSTVPHVDKVVHLALYLGLGWLVPRAFAKEGGARWGWFLGLFLYGFFDEFTQPYFQRTFEWADLVADGVGIAAGIWFGRPRKKD